MNKLQSKKPKIFNFTLLFCVFIFTFCVFGEASGAVIYFDSEENSFPPDTVFPVDIKLNTEMEEVNTVGVKFNFSDDIFDVEGFSDGNSLINFWVEKPGVKGNTVYFSGVIPGGFLGEDGLLAKIFLKAKKEGSGELRFSDESQVFLNDGEGTLAELVLRDIKLEIKQGAPVPVVAEDKESPEGFSPKIASDPDIFDGKYFLVFGAQDKGSGIDYYKVKEGRGEFEIVESPYLLKDQSLKSDIVVQAVDNSGNIREEEMKSALKPIYHETWFWGIVIVLLIIVGASSKFKKQDVQSGSTKP